MERGIAVVLALALAAGAPLAVAATPLTWQAIRPQGQPAALLFERALASSATVRALAARIQRSDVIVYVELRPSLPSGSAAQMTWMATTPSHRLLRVSMRLGMRQADAIGFVAHELQHAVEVVEHPDVRSAADLDALYRRIGERGAPSLPHWDTLDAINAERVARLEALRPPAGGRHSG